MQAPAQEEQTSEIPGDNGSEEVAVSGKNNLQVRRYKAGLDEGPALSNSSITEPARTHRALSAR